MEAAAQARILILLIVLLALIGSLSWCLMSWVVRISPLASCRFSKT